MTNDPYKICEPLRQTAPDLPGEAIVRASADDAIDALAADMFGHALNCVQTFGDFHLALSGGRTLGPLYLRLMCDPALRAFPWQRTHLWLTSERWRTSADVEESGEVFEQLRDTIVEHSGIPRAQVYSIDTQAADPARDYERRLKETLAWREKGHDRLDLSILSVGGGGRVAGVTSVSSESAETLVAPTTPRASGDGSFGATLTLRMLNASRLIAILATGQRKASVVRAIAGASAAEQAGLPACALAPVGGSLRWYLDEAACASDSD